MIRRELLQQFLVELLAAAGGAAWGNSKNKDDRIVSMAGSSERRLSAESTGGIANPIPITHDAK